MIQELRGRPGALRQTASVTPAYIFSCRRTTDFESISKVQIVWELLLVHDGYFMFDIFNSSTISDAISLTDSTSQVVHVLNGLASEINSYTKVYFSQLLRTSDTFQFIKFPSSIFQAYSFVIRFPVLYFQRPSFVNLVHIKKVVL